MFNLLGSWPYAAKPAIQHEFDNDHLNIWLTFPLTMRIKATPATSLFTAILDTIDYDISTAVWQDAYTLLLTVSGLSGRPSRVLLKYEGPTKDLEITWHKQWEPFGPILSADIET
jgi:hypothetical protein